MKILQAGDHNYTEIVIMLPIFGHTLGIFPYFKLLRSLITFLFI